MSVAEAIAASICLPDEFPPVRVSDSYTCNPTALAKVSTEIKLNWSGASTGSVPEDDALVFMFRDALRWLVVYDPNISGQSYQYNWQQFGGVTSFNGPGGIPWFVPVCAATVDPTSTWAPHGGTMFAGDADGVGYMWVDADVAINLTDVGTVENGTVYIWLFDQGQQIYYDEQVFPGNTSIAYTPTISGYFAIQILFPGSAHQVTINTQDAVGQPVWRHIAVPDVDSNLHRVQSLCLSASSILWRNTASYDNAQGDVGGVIIGPSMEWWTLIGQGSASYNGLASLFPNGWKSFFAAKGLYAYLKPSDEEDIEFKSNFKSFPQGQWAFARFNLRNSSNYAALAMSVSLDAGRDTLLRAAAHIQYESNDCWADTRVPEANVDDWLSAVKMTANVPNITENPVHVKDIIQAIGKVGLIVNNVQQRVAPYVGAAASLIPGGSVVAKIGQASLPYQKRAFQYLSTYGDTSGAFDDGPRTNVDPRQN
jgi:hypothetical protein